MSQELSLNKVFKRLHTSKALKKINNIKYPEPWWTITAAKSYRVLPLDVPLVSCYSNKNHFINSMIIMKTFTIYCFTNTSF